MQIYTWVSNITFHLQQIWLQTLVAIDPEPLQTEFPSFYTQPWHLKQLFESKQTPFLGQVVKLGLLLHTGFN